MEVLSRLEDFHQQRQFNTKVLVLVTDTLSQFILCLLKSNLPETLLELSLLSPLPTESYFNRRIMLSAFSVPINCHTPAVRVGSKPLHPCPCIKGLTS